jgi:hypothetical protein
LDSTASHANDGNFLSFEIDVWVKSSCVAYRALEIVQSLNLGPFPVTCISLDQRA